MSDLVQFSRSDLEDLITRSHMAIAQVQSNGLGDIKTSLALLQQSVGQVHTDTLEVKALAQKTNGRVTALETKTAVMDENTATLKKIVYGAVGLVLVAFAGGLTSIVFIK